MNADPAHGLFRREVVERRARRLEGEVSLAVPASWQVVGYTLLFCLILAIGFLAVASHARTQVVQGTITLDKGIVPITPARPGQLLAIRVAEGQRVREGQELAWLGSEENLANGRLAPVRSVNALKAQNSALVEQVARIDSAAAADRDRLAGKINSLRQELSSVEEQIRAQERLLILAKGDFDQVKSISGRGFVSRRDVDLREAALITRQQQLEQLRQARSAKLGEIDDARSAMVQATETAAGQSAAVQANRAQLGRSLEELEQRAGYRLTAPIAGTVTSVTARVGQPVGNGSTLMAILPAGATFTAELEVPTASAGFLEVGQEVQLLIDAYPHQQFGAIEGRIALLPRAAVSRPSPDGTMKSVYSVVVAIPRPFVHAFGKRHGLRAGMSVTARIVTRRQSLLRTLFEPVLSLGRN